MSTEKRCRWDITAIRLPVHWKDYFQLSTFKPARRYCVGSLAAVGFFFMYWMRYSIIAKFITAKNSISFEELETMDSAFYWGYALGQIPGGLLVLRTSAHRVIGLSIAVTSLLHMACGVVSDFSFSATIVLAILQGITAGPLSAAVIGLWVHWAPPSEKTRLVILPLWGAQLGLVIGFVLSSQLTRRFGPNAGFLTIGILCLIWCLLWTNFTYERPACDPGISQKELSYLESTICEDVKIPVRIKEIPWKALALSPPVLVIYLADICFTYAIYVSLIGPIIFFNYVLHIEKLLGYNIQLAYLILLIVLPVSGVLADFVINKSYLSTVTTRKLFSGIAFTSFGILVLVSAFHPNDATGKVSLFIGRGLLSCGIAGFVVNSLDICPRYASLVHAISQTFAAVTDIIMIYVIKSIALSDKQYFTYHWRIVFVTLSVLSFLTAILYCIFASAELLPWAKSNRTSDRTDTRGRSDAAYYPTCDSEDNSILVSDAM